MIIKTLIDNISNIENLRSQHGLSLYIETKNHKLLFDMGAGGLFVENAKKMQVDLSAVDLAVISHGHYDHGGGLEAFLRVNSKAKVYLNKNAYRQLYANGPNNNKKYIGLDEALLPNDRFVFVGDQFLIDDELELFANVKGDKLSPSGNRDLFMKVDSSFMPDDFAHEQNLIIKEDEKTLLIAGCAHNGIVNIMEQFHTSNGNWPSHVIGGFHLYNRSTDEYEDAGKVSDIGAYLMKTAAKFYTCHCTGIESYEILKSIMGDRVDYLSTGSQLII